MKKSIALIALLMAAMMMLAGCGADKKTAEPAAEPAAQTEEAATEETPTEEAPVEETAEG